MIILIIHTRDIILHIQQRIITAKAHEKFQPNWLKIFQEKVENVKKCINYAHHRYGTTKYGMLAWYYDNERFCKGT